MTDADLERKRKAAGLALDLVVQALEEETSADGAIKLVRGMATILRTLRQLEGEAARNARSDGDGAGDETINDWRDTLARRVDRVAVARGEEPMDPGSWRGDP